MVSLAFFWQSALVINTIYFIATSWTNKIIKNKCPYDIVAELLAAASNYVPKEFQFPKKKILFKNSFFFVEKYQFRVGNKANGIITTFFHHFSFRCHSRRGQIKGRKPSRSTLHHKSGGMWRFPFHQMV